MTAEATAGTEPSLTLPPRVKTLKRTEKEMVERETINKTDDSPFCTPSDLLSFWEDACTNREAKEEDVNGNSCFPLKVAVEEIEDMITPKSETTSSNNNNKELPVIMDMDDSSGSVLEQGDRYKTLELEPNATDSVCNEDSSILNKNIEINNNDDIALPNDVDSPLSQADVVAPFPTQQWAGDPLPEPVAIEGEHNNPLSPQTIPQITVMLQGEEEKKEDNKQEIELRISTTSSDPTAKSTRSPPTSPLLAVNEEEEMQNAIDPAISPLSQTSLRSPTQKDKSFELKEKATITNPATTSTMVKQREENVETSSRKSNKSGRSTGFMSMFVEEVEDLISQLRNADSFSVRITPPDDKSESKDSAPLRSITSHDTIHYMYTGEDVNSNAPPPFQEPQELLQQQSEKEQEQVTKKKKKKDRTKEDFSGMDASDLPESVKSRLRSIELPSAELVAKAKKSVMKKKNKRAEGASTHSSSDDESYDDDDDNEDEDEEYLDDVLDDDEYEISNADLSSQGTEEAPENTSTSLSDTSADDDDDEEDDEDAGEDDEEVDDIDLDFVEQYDNAFNEFLGHNPNFLIENPDLVHNLRVTKLQRMLEHLDSMEADLTMQMERSRRIKSEMEAKFQSDLIQASRIKASREIQLNNHLKEIRRSTKSMQVQLMWHLLTDAEEFCKEQIDLTRSLGRQSKSTNRLEIVKLLPDDVEFQDIRNAILAPAARSPVTLSDEQEKDVKQFQMDNAFLNAEVTVLQRKLNYQLMTAKKHAWVQSVLLQMDDAARNKLKKRLQKKSGIAIV